MKKEKLGALVFWASLLVLAVCAFLLVGRPTLIPTGIPGDAVAFGMGAEEVAQTAGPPDGTRSEEFVALQFGGADTGDAETFRALVWDTFFTDAGVQLYLLANEYAGVNDEGQTAINADMQPPLEAACMLVVNRLAAVLAALWRMRR